MSETKKPNRFAASVSSLRDENSVTKVGKTEIGSENQNEIEDRNFNMSNIVDTINANQPKGKPETFYLSNEVTKEIEKISKYKKISKSKLVDEILKKVLLND